MRTDYPLYVIAVICFLVAIYAYAAPLAETELYIYALAVLGIVFIGLGYMARPKEGSLSETTLTPSMPAPPSEPLPAEIQPKEKPKTPRKTPVKRRARKKSAAKKRRKK
ncbi:MAG: hypothetical protein JSV05_00850 [Candidatus Bathyarchaeota archaeon]|nr:MAG: hypothetical protein JSV05_00850 [Candidatus Bathyarchaeota archaeon]